MTKVTLKDFVAVVLAMQKGRRELGLPQKSSEVISLNFVREIVEKWRKRDEAVRRNS